LLDLGLPHLELDRDLDDRSHFAFIDRQDPIISRLDRISRHSPVHRAVGNRRRQELGRYGGKFVLILHGFVDRVPDVVVPLWDFVMA
jgi:hypothetical protein